MQRTKYKRIWKQNKKFPTNRNNCECTAECKDGYAQPPVGSDNFRGCYPICINSELDKKNNNANYAVDIENNRYQNKKWDETTQTCVDCENERQLSDGFTCEYPTAYRNHFFKEIKRENSSWIDTYGQEKCPENQFANTTTIGTKLFGTVPGDNLEHIIRNRNICETCSSDKYFDTTNGVCKKCPDGLVPDLNKCKECDKENQYVYDANINGCKKCDAFETPQLVNGKWVCKRCPHGYEVDTTKGINESENQYERKVKGTYCHRCQQSTDENIEVHGYDGICYDLRKNEYLKRGDGTLSPQPEQCPSATNNMFHYKNNANSAKKIASNECDSDDTECQTIKTLANDHNWYTTSLPSNYYSNSQYSELYDINQTDSSELQKAYRKYYNPNMLELEGNDVSEYADGKIHITNVDWPLEKSRVPKLSSLENDAENITDIHKSCAYKCKSNRAEVDSNKSYKKKRLNYMPYKVSCKKCTSNQLYTIDPDNEDQFTCKDLSPNICGANTKILEVADGYKVELDENNDWKAKIKCQCTNGKMNSKEEMMELHDVGEWTEVPISRRNNYLSSKEGMVEVDKNGNVNETTRGIYCTEDEVKCAYNQRFEDGKCIYCDPNIFTLGIIGSGPDGKTIYDNNREWNSLIDKKESTRMIIRIIGAKILQNVKMVIIMKETHQKNRNKHLFIK